MFVTKRRYLELEKKYKTLERKYSAIFASQEAKNEEIEKLNKKLLYIDNDKTNIFKKKYEELKEKYKRILFINNGSQELIKDPTTELPPKFNFERLKRIQLEPKEEEAKHYLERIEKNITKKHMNNAQIGRAIDERMYSVKNRLEPLTKSWTTGKGYNCKELLNDLINILEEAINRNSKVSNKNGKEKSKKNIDIIISIMFEDVLKEGLKNGFIEYTMLEKIDYDKEIEINNHFEAIEELEDRGIRIK